MLPPPQAGVVNHLLFGTLTCTSRRLPTLTIHFVKWLWVHLNEIGYGSVVVLYVCPSGTSFGGLPAPIAHPCGRAAKALDDAGHAYDIKQVKGGTAKLWTWPSRAHDRAEVERLSGQRAVPILVLDDGEIVTSSGAIARWAREHPAKSHVAAA
jgi:hypothetical protein